VGVILVCMFGLLALLDIPVQLKPDVSKPVITVETRWPGASPQEVEKEIIEKQEEQLKSIEGMTQFKSESFDSRGRITMEFAVGTDMQSTLLKVGNKLDQVTDYPIDAEEPNIESVDTSQGFIAWIILNAKPPTHDELRAFLKEHPELKEPLEPVLAQDQIELRRLIQIGRHHPAMKQLIDQLVDTSLMKRFAEDEIETRLERVPGVSNSNVIGGREEEMRVVVDSAKLAARQITIVELRDAMAAENKDISGGDIWDEKSRVVVRTLGQFSEIEHVENVIVARRGGAPVRVKDVARVELGYSKPQSIVRRMGMPSIAINVQRDPKANVLEVMAGVQAAIDEMNAEGGILAARGVELTQVYDETIYIKSSTTLVRNNMLLGAILAVAVLLVFLRSARSTLVVALAIPISVIGTFLIISALGRSINVISLAGMSFAVGMVVDAAIVVLENIYSHYQRGESPLVAAGRGTAEVWGAVLASTLTTLAVFLPVVFVEEQAGQLFRDIAIAISGAVALSLIVSVIVIPVAASRILRERTAHGAGEAKQARDGAARLGRWIVDALVRMTDRLQSGRLGTRVVIAMCVLFALGSIGTALAGWSLAKPVPFTALAIALVVSAAFVPLAWRLPRAAFAATMISLSIGISLAIMPPAEYLPEGNRNLVIGIVLPPPGYNFDQLEEIGDTIEAEMSPYWEADPGSPEEALLDGPAIEHFFFVARGRSIFMGTKAADPSRAAELLPVIARSTAKVPGTLTIPIQSSLFDRALSGGRKIEIEITGPEMERLIAVGGQ
ncbi:MAG: efflux RND transporter permease subunit, partial [Planctomycetes bacterium]|nr:efflux RND transporter permease subunit [Planctomycetota bacterium]